MKITGILSLFYFYVLASAIGPPSGDYYIVPDAFDGQGNIGRSRVEDRSLLPKQILLLNEPAEPWSVQRQSDGKYVLSQRGGLAGERNGLLFAFIIQEQTTDRWLIESSTQDGNRIFTIRLDRDPIRGWVSPTPDDDSKQIRVEPLISGPSGPPFYRPTELFQLIPFYNE